MNAHFQQNIFWTYIARDWIEHTLPICPLSGSIGIPYLALDSNYVYSANLVFSLNDLFDDLIQDFHCLQMDVFFTGTFTIDLKQDGLTDIGKDTLYKAHLQNNNNWMRINVLLDPDSLLRLGTSTKLVISTSQDTMLQVYTDISVAISNIHIRSGLCLSDSLGKTSIYFWDIQVFVDKLPYRKIVLTFYYNIIKSHSWIRDVECQSSYG